MESGCYFLFGAGGVDSGCYFPTFYYTSEFDP